MYECVCVCVCVCLGECVLEEMSAWGNMCVYLK